MSTTEPFDRESSTCPHCGKPVAWKWATGPRGGFISEPHNVLIADCVFHAKCWDEMATEDGLMPPAPKPDTAS